VTRDDALFLQHPIGEEVVVILDPQSIQESVTVIFQGFKRGRLEIFPGQRFDAWRRLSELVGYTFNFIIGIASLSKICYHGLTGMPIAKLQLRVTVVEIWLTMSRAQSLVCTALFEHRNTRIRRRHGDSRRKLQVNWGTRLLYSKNSSS